MRLPGAAVVAPRAALTRGGRDDFVGAFADDMPRPKTPQKKTPVHSGDAGPTGRAPVLGIVGGGQLARMLAQAASELGLSVAIIEKARAVPAASVAATTLVGDWNTPDALRALGREADVVTLENEFVDAGALAALERDGVTLYPASAAIDLIQDKLRQREVLRDARLPVPEFCAVDSLDDLKRAGETLGWPLMLKTRRNGYDGKGNATVRDLDDVPRAWQVLGAGAMPLLAEGFCRFRCELAVIVCRGRDGRMVSYPVVETIQRDHICHVVKAPAALPAAVARRAAAVARRAVEAFGLVGSVGVELFLMPDGRIVVNELAPRVHNSGHYTIEACACSQFENHVRAVLGWPLGSPAMVAPAAVMVNLLGHGDGPGHPTGLEAALAVPGVHVHLYGKSRSVRGRKMGHLTVLGPAPGPALSRARRAARLLRFGGPS